MARLTSQVEYTRLSQSPFWQRQHRLWEREGARPQTKNIVPHYFADGPFLAQAFAQIVIAYLDDCFAANHNRPARQDRENPIYIVELGAESGRFSFHFLNFFIPMCAERGQDAPTLRYIMTNSSMAAIEFWRSHKQLQSFIEQGVLDFACFDADADERLRLLVSGVDVSDEVRKGPLVAIANHVFSRLPHDLFEIKDGELYERLAETGGSDHPDADASSSERGVEITYLTKAFPSGYYRDEEWNRILQRYCEILGDAAVLFPVGALRCLERLWNLSNGGLMLLCGDRGPHLPEALAEQRSPFLMRRDGYFQFDVNLHAVSEYTKQRGGYVLQTPHAPAHINVLAFLFGQEQTLNHHIETAFNRHIAGFGPDDFFNLLIEAKKNPGALGLAAIVSLLRLSQWDYGVIFDCYEWLVQILPGATEMEKQNFYQAIRAVEERHFLFATEENPDFYFGTLMGIMGWREEAIAYYSRAKTIYNTAATEHNLGLSYLLSGNLEEALDSFNGALDLDPNMISAKQLARKISAWLSVEKYRPVEDGAVESRLSHLDNWPSIRARLEHPDLKIEPLLQRHARDMRRYATPEIMNLTRLPVFATLNEVEDWINATASEPRNYTFAIIHRDFGFIGVVSVTAMDDKAGRIFFWLGAPFMGKGYAAAAACQLLRFACDTLRMDELFTCALVHNERSGRLLQRIGFRRVELLDAKLHYYRNGVERLEQCEITRRLARFFEKAEPKIIVRRIKS
jgi:RimJ/RimL family protein N-acetyltransferase